MSKTLNIKGGSIMMVLMFAGVFLVSVSALLQFVLQQSMSGRGKVASEEALQIAEAGLEYYKWHLANNPESEWSGTIEQKDSQSGNRIGEFTINTTVNKQCGEIMNRDVEVVGTSDKDNRFSSTLSARYMLPSVTNYSYIIDESVWAGSSRSIIGPYYSSGGIRMDAVHNSIVASGVSSWNCDGSFGCNPDQAKDGVWGGGSQPELWQYPKILTDFTDIAPDLSDLKDKAQDDGQYFDSVSDGDGDKGYRIVFKSNGTFDMYRVDSASYNWGWISGGGAYRNYHTITSETFIGNYTVPSDCSLIFVEDQVWLEGVVNGRVALVVADTINDYSPDVVLHDNLTYADSSAVDGITVIAENDILISAKSPEDLTINGVFVASGGKFGRNHYVETSGYYWNFAVGWWQYMPGVGSAQDLDTLTINGSIVSSKRTGTSWAYGVYKQRPWWGYDYLSQNSGFSNRINSYERVQAFNPPPFTPSASNIPYYVNWKEK